MVYNQAKRDLRLLSFSQISFKGLQKEIWVRKVYWKANVLKQNGFTNL